MAQEKNFLDLQAKFNWKRLLILLLFAVGIYFLIPKLVGAQQALKLILHIDKYSLLLAIIAEIISYSGAAWLLGIILYRLGYKIRFWDRFRIGSIAAFAIHFFPLGTFGEGAVDFYFLRKRKVEAGSILLMLILRIIITYTAFLLVFLIGLVLVPTVPYLPFSPRVISLVLAFLVIGGVFYLYYLYQNKEKFRKTWGKFIRFVDFFLSKFRGRYISPEKETEIFDDIYRGIGLFGKKKRFSILAVIAGIIYWLGDLTCFFFVFLSFGYQIHWSVLVFGYGISSLFGMLSFIPGGLGVVEGSMGLIYSGLGVPSGLALMSILVFRFFSFWIWIPFGLYSFVSLTREKSRIGERKI
ncbi:hypothetical protein A2V71_01270 [Candidatus Berkelbacteria bacterium RBG_13_40_8]|uniref:Flippase-like domain-containing protein n=1 Tax=Candidatus Berkelbacteria bacterium RBG_13_40_8 TaxID=1797467 RepID=A0A1F5DMU0_9BACT|nr:MAG: hypothetical protein A2V71_01270 [Candidatus Berkelbacteria bacterium RBG_13_40_8]